MDNAAVPVPSLAKVAAALHKTTEVLAHELAAPTDGPPSWSEFEWRIARAVTGMQGISSLLCDGLRWEGPHSWRRFLHEQRSQSVGRHRLISDLLNAIDSRARSEGVAVTALKGAALYAGGLYAPGERPMGDIDLLIRDEDAAKIARVLDACGYEAAFTVDRHRVFRSRFRKVAQSVRLGEHVDSPINIEVHTRIAEHLPMFAADITHLLLPRVAHPGVNAYPSSAALMMHLLLHAAGNMRARAVRLIQLHDIALLSTRLRPGDWGEVLAARPDGHTLWWAFAPLMLTANYFPGSIPDGLTAQLGRECPWLLRKRARRQQISDVSWSKIRIEAFPGVEWSRTTREALSFMRSRVWPSREAQSELKEGAAQIPGSSTVSWYGISHGARIMRWVFSKPPRVQTLLSVRAALDHPR